MSFALILALFLSVVLLVTTAYFLLGSVPLLILKHDTPLDARFVGRFYSVYYRAVMFVAAATSICYALARLPSFALGAMAIALLSAVFRRQVIGAMEALGARIAAGDAAAVRDFRTAHVACISTSVLQVAVII